MLIQRILSSGIALTMLTPALLPAATLHVPDDHSTISAAIHAAAEGDTVLVGPGEYTEYIELDKNLVLRSTDGPEATKLISSGLGESPLEEKLLVLKGENLDRSTVIEGFSLDSGGYSGSAIEVDQGGPTIRGNVIDSPFGWGIKIVRGNPRIEGNVIKGTRTFGIAVAGSSPEIFRNEITECSPRAIDVSGARSHPVIGGSAENANRIYGNPLDIVNGSRNDIDATFNDWGWATTTEMEAGPYPQDVSTIQDGNDLKRSNRGKGQVDYRNWIGGEAAGESAPRDMPWMLIGLIALGVVIVGVIVARR